MSGNTALERRPEQPQAQGAEDLILYECVLQLQYLHSAGVIFIFN